MSDHKHAVDDHDDCAPWCSACCHESQLRRKLERYEEFIRRFPGDECRRQVAGHPPSLIARLLFTKETQVHSLECIGCRAQRLLEVRP